MGFWPPSNRKDDCTQYAANYVYQGTAAGLLVGFFEAFNDAKATRVDKPLPFDVRMAYSLKSARIMAAPALFFAAVAGTYAVTECTSAALRGQDDTWNGILAGYAAGAVVGLRKGRISSAINYGSLFAAGTGVYDLVSKVAHNAFDDIKIYGPVEQK